MLAEPGAPGPSGCTLSVATDDDDEMHATRVELKPVEHTQHALSLGGGSLGDGPQVNLKLVTDRALLLRLATSPPPIPWR